MPILLLAALAAAPPAPAPRPALVVTIVVDQLRPDYLVRWRGQFTGGLRQLLETGVVYTNGMQDHAVTETAPGHASILSGRFPRSTGIQSNNRGVPDPAYPLVGSSGPGAAPARFRGTTLYDWMRVADSTTQVLSISRKDRGAILPVGRGGRDVYWFVRGAAVTSQWYADSLPGWVQDWNRRDGAGRLAGAVWTPLLADTAYAESDAFDFEHGGRDARFPHRLPGTPDSARVAVGSFPWSDSLTLDFALEGVRRTGLGTRGRTDLLNVSLSTTDAVGHDYGPDSRELHDQVLRVDRWLGPFLDSLRTLVRGPVAVVLTADHGVQPMPAFARLAHKDAGVVSLDTVLARHARALRSRYDANFRLETDSGLLFADVEALRARGVDVAALSRRIAADVARLPGVARVFTPATLAAASGRDPLVRRWRHLLGTEAGWLVAATTREGWIWGWREGYATHGSPHALDVHVPIVFSVPGVAPRMVSRPVRTVDIGPTLAAWLGVRPTEPVDGVVLPEVVPRR